MSNGSSQVHVLLGNENQEKKEPICGLQGILKTPKKNNPAGNKTKQRVSFSISKPDFEPPVSASEQGTASQQDKATQGFITTEFPCHAEPHQGAAGEQDQGVGRDATSRVETQATPCPLCRAQRVGTGEEQEWCRQPPYRDEQSIKEEEHTARLPPEPPVYDDHRQRDDLSPPCPGQPEDHGEHRASRPRCDGVRAVLQHDLSGGEGLSPQGHPVVSHHDVRRGGQLADEALHEVGGDEEQESDFWQQPKDQVPTRASHGHLQEAIRRVNIIDRHRGLIHGSDISLHGVRTGRQSPPDRDREPDSRAPTAASTPSKTGSESGEEGRDREGLSEAPDLKLSHAPIRSNEQPLNNRHKKEIQYGFAVGFEKDWASVAYGNRLRLLEVCCSEDSVLSRTCEQMFGSGSSQRISKWNGGDIETKAGVEYVKSVISDRRPELVWMSPECGPFSPMQHLNMRDDRQRMALTEKRQKAKKQYESVCEIGRHAHSIGVPFVIELSERCEGWKLPMFTSLQQDLQCSAGVCKGCQVGLRNASQELMGKGWRLMGTCKGLIQNMTLKCQGNHQHGNCEGSKNCQLSAFYTPQFAKRVMESLQRVDLCHNVVRELQGGISFDVELNSVNHIHAEPCQHANHEHDHHVFAMSPERRSTIMQSLRRIHAATGHCSNEYLVKALRKRNADQDTIELAKQFRCPSCEEQKGPNPRNMSNLEDIPPKWSRVQIDGGTWNHPETKEPFHFMLGIDEGSRFRMGMILKPGKKISLSGDYMITFVEERWKPIFGKPAVIRMDPAGGFRSEAVNQHFAEQKVLIEHIPGESHWQISAVERAIQTTKNMMGKLALEFPEMSCREIFLKSIWAQNIRDQYMGFSPLQHAMGRNPDDYEHIHKEGTKDFPIITEKGISAEFGNDQKSMQSAEEAFLKEQYNQKLLRAQRSGSRKLAVFKPGDLVFYWRKQIGTHGAEAKGQPFKTGAFL